MGDRADEGPNGSRDDVPSSLVEAVHVQQLQALLDLTSKKDSVLRKVGDSVENELQLCHQLTLLFSSPEKLTAIFSIEADVSYGRKHRRTQNAAGIDFKAVWSLYHNIKAMDVASVSEAVVTASQQLVDEVGLSKAGKLKDEAATSGSGRRVVGSLLIVFANPLLLEPENHPLLQCLAKALTSLGPHDRALAVSTLSSLPAEDLEEMVATVQQCITVQLYEACRVTEAVQLCTKLLKLLYDANLKSGDLPISAFYNDAVNNKDLVDPASQYIYWKKPQRYSFSFCNYPFILDLATKSGILQLDSSAEMQEQFHRAIFSGLFNNSGFIEPFNVMRVRRDHLIHDAITHVQRRKDDLKKQLKVQFIGEDAVDEGGVRKEFFQLVVQELLDPKYGMFTYQEESRQFWFSLQAGELAQIQEEQEEMYREGLKRKDGESQWKGAMDWCTEEEARSAGSVEATSAGGLAEGGAPATGAVRRKRSGAGLEDLELRREYGLVGMLLGLAIYNQCILEVRFPAVVYKKLLGRRLGLDDLELMDKDLAKGLRDLLTFEGDVQEVFQRNFQVTVVDIFGDTHTVDLKPGGGEIPLTAENRQEYVDLCVKFYLETSVARQFEAFSKGFKHLVPGDVLKLFEPEELELLICGQSDLDFDDLEKGSKYADGFTRSHKTIRQFWEIAHDLSDSEKRNLLMFVTGCERAPVRGLNSLTFTISRNGPDSDRLPTAHTCFNHLLLPEYKSKEKMKNRLLTAINNAKGFGLH